MKKGTKRVYVPMSADIIHHGHINIINKANTYGDVIVGLNSDAIIKNKKGKMAVMGYEERFKVVKNIQGVSDVVLQDTDDYVPNLMIIKPDFVVHGDDWSEEKKNTVIKTLDFWGGKLVEEPYIKDISSSIIKQRILDMDKT